MPSRWPDGVPGGVSGSGNHGVRQPVIDHHRAEVTDVEHRFPGPLLRHALVLPKFKVL